MMEEGLVLEHGEQCVTSASSEADAGGVVLLTFGSLSVVLGATGVGVQAAKSEGNSARLSLPVPDLAGAHL